MHPGENEIARCKTNRKQCRESDQSPPNRPTQYYPRRTETKCAQDQQVQPSIQRTKAPSGKNGVDKIRVDFNAGIGSLSLTGVGMRSPISAEPNPISTAFPCSWPPAFPLSKSTTETAKNGGDISPGVICPR